MMTQYSQSTAGRHLAGPSDPLANQIADALNNAFQGGPQGSAQNKERVEFFSDVLSKTGEKFVESPKGKAALSDTAKQVGYGVVVPLSLVAFVAGYLLGKKKG